jgi:predicted ATP-binding protein involved in virulence
MSEWSGAVTLISDQRLIKKTMDEDEVVDAILDLPKTLKGNIDGVSAEYSRVSNNLDSTYPKRLLTSEDEITQPDYQKRLNEAEDKFKKLKEYNLAELSLFGEGEFNSKYATELKIYFDDFDMKYKVFDRLIAQLDLFTSILNGRLLFKRIEISREEGFLVKDTANNSRILPLGKLSSGEKQEILLFFDLIFRTNKELLLLIDEPELSLHISWQQNFLDDLLKVRKMNELSVIVATHSPQIIGNHRDIQIDLGELYNGD